MKKKIIKITLGITLALVILGLKSGVAKADTITWDGGGGADTNWSTCANWIDSTTATNDVCPTSADAVVFSATSTNNSTVDSGFGGAITSLSVNSGYTGTITQARSLTISNTMTLSAGHFTADSQSLSVASTFTMNSGSDFTASSGTTTLSGFFTINGGAFNANGGTVTFDGTIGATLSCNNITFNLVTFAKTTNTTTVNSNCSLPLGSNPGMGSAGFALSLNGTLSGSGTLTKAAGTLTMNASTATLSGFTGLSVSAFTIQNSATVDLSSYTSFVAASTVTLSSGSLTLPNGADLNGALTISGGIFTAPSGIMTLAGSLTISGTPIFNANGGTITIDGNSATLSCNNVTFNLITFNQNTGGGKTVNSNCSLPLGSNPSMPNALTLAGTFTGSGTLSFTGPNVASFNSGATLTGFSGISFPNDTGGFTVSGATLDFTNYTTSHFNLFTLSSGTFTAPTGTMTVTNIFTHSGGTFNHNNGTVDLGNVFRPQTISGSTTFYNLTKTGIANQPNLSFTAGTTQTVLGTLTLRGASGSPLPLRSTSTGSQWNIDVQGARALSNLDVQDSNNINTNAMVANNSNDSGNNINWIFTSPSISFALDYPGGNSHTTNPHPTYRWSKANVTNNSAVTKYELYVDNGASNDFYIDSISPSVAGNGMQNNLNYILYDDGSYLNLTTKDPFGALIGYGKKNWRIVAHDSAGNIREESLDFFFDALIKSSFPTPTAFPFGIFAIIPTPFPTSSPLTITGTPIPSLPSISLPSLPTMVGTISSFRLPNIALKAVQAASVLILLGLLPIAAALTIIGNLATTGFGGNAITRSLQALGILPMGATEGIVYSSVTNKPVPFAVITIKNEVKGSGIYETLVTDSHGLYGSVKLTPGIYRATVRHQDYSFPTLATRPLGLSLHDFYKGDAFPVTSQKENNFLVIPVDPLSTEAQKGAFRPVLQALNNISQVLFIPAGIFSAFVFIGNMNIFNGVILGIYSGILVFKSTKLLKFPTFKGSVVDKNGEAIPDALIRLTDSSGKIIEATQSDTNGKYNLYSERGVYNLYVTRLNYIDPKTNITQIDTRKTGAARTQLLKWSN